MQHSLPATQCGQSMVNSPCAHQGMMKECHPDRSNVEANEFCALLNEVYEVGACKHTAGL